MAGKQREIIPTMQNSHGGISELVVEITTEESGSSFSLLSAKYLQRQYRACIN